MKKLFGHVKNDNDIRNHVVEPAIRDLPGKKVEIYPETAVPVEHGVRVDVMPVDKSLKKPTSLCLQYIDVDKPTEDAIYQAIKQR